MQGLERVLPAHGGGGLKRTHRPGPVWNEPEDRGQEVERTLEAQVEMRRKTKSLTDCSLPEGFRLVTPVPRNLLIKGLVKRSIVLAFGPADDTYYFAQVYECEVSDEVQLGWALEEFTNELQAAGVAMPGRRAA